MIYVCRVDTGSRHIFDLADGIENVGSLVNKIESQFKIDKSKQILLISGGEVLDDYQRKFYGYGFGCVRFLLIVVCVLIWIHSKKKGTKNGSSSAYFLID